MAIAAMIMAIVFISHVKMMLVLVLLAVVVVLVVLALPALVLLDVLKEGKYVELESFDSCSGALQ